MAPESRIFLTRHAQAEHNVDLDYSILDAPLTPLGKKQASSVAPRIADLQDQVDLVVTSPLRRTLQTSLRTWGAAIDRLGRENVICLPEAQECNGYPCDTGSPRAELEQDAEFAGLDFSRLTDDWTSKTGFWAPDGRSLTQRARFVRHFLRDRPEKNIVLVAHGDILRQITCDAGHPSDYMWKNAEVRIYTFDQASVDSDDCLLSFEKAVDSAKGYGRFSTEAELMNESNGKL